MSSDPQPYGPTGTRYLSADEKARGLAAIARIEDAWLFQPERVEDLERLSRVRMNVRIGHVADKDHGWLCDRMRGE